MYSLVVIDNKERVMCQNTLRKLLELQVPMIIVDSFVCKWQAERALRRVRGRPQRNHDWQSWLDEDVDVTE